MPNKLSSINSLVKIRVFLGMLSPNLASKTGYLCSLRKYCSFFVKTLDSFSRFLKHVTFLVETWQSNFAELRPFRKTIKNAINFRLFWKKESKKNRKLFGDQNRNRIYSIVLKQFISKPAAQSTQFDALWECYAKWAQLQIRQYKSVWYVWSGHNLCTCNFRTPKNIQLQPQ